MTTQPNISDAVCDCIIDIGNGNKPVRVNKRMGAVLLLEAAALEAEADRRKFNAELQARTERQASVPDGLSAETDC